VALSTMLGRAGRDPRRDPAIGSAARGVANCRLATDSLTAEGKEGAAGPGPFQNLIGQWPLSFSPPDGIITIRAARQGRGVWS